MMILEREGKPCWSIDYSPDGQSLAAACGDELVLWNVSNQRAQWSFPGSAHRDTSKTSGYNLVRFSPNGTELALGHQNSYYGRPMLHIHSYPDLSHRQTLTSRGYGAGTQAVYSPNGSCIAVNGGPVSIWHESTDEQGRVLLGAWEQKMREGGAFWSNIWVHSLAFLPNGWLVIGATSENYIRMSGWTYQSKKTGNLKIRDPYALRDSDKVKSTVTHNGDIYAIACSPNGNLIAYSAGKNIKIWDLQNREDHATLKGHRRYVRHLAFTPDGEHLVSSTWDEVKVWDVASGRAVGTYKWEIGKLTSLAMAPDGMTAAVASEEGKIAIWDLDSGS